MSQSYAYFYEESSMTSDNPQTDPCEFISNT